MNSHIIRMSKKTIMLLAKNNNNMGKKNNNNNNNNSAPQLWHSASIQLSSVILFSHNDNERPGLLAITDIVHMILAFCF